MTAPVNTKSIRVSPETHARIARIADRTGGTMEGALAFLLGESTIRVPVSDTERARWTEAADRLGLSVEEFVKLRVEAALQYGADPLALMQVYEYVRGIADTVGARPRPVYRAPQEGRK